MASVWDPLELYIGLRQRSAVDRGSQAVPSKTKTEKEKSSAVGNLRKELPAVAVLSSVTLGYTQPPATSTHLKAASSVRYIVGPSSDVGEWGRICIKGNRLGADVTLCTKCSQCKLEDLTLILESI